MPRTSGDANTDFEIKQKLKSGNYKTILDLERFDEALSQWVVIEDIDVQEGVNWKDSTKRKEFLNYSLTPLANPISFTVINQDGKYSEGSGQPEENKLVNGTKIRLNLRYSVGLTENLLDENGDPLLDENGIPLRISETHFIYQSVYHLDSPEFIDPGVGELSIIRCEGRDIYKRAIETDINLPTVTGLSLDTIIKNICDQIGIQYTATSIADLSGFSNRTLTTGLEDITKADEVFELIMYILQSGEETSTDRYQMFLEYDSTIEDNILFVQKLPELFEADFVFTANEYLTIGSIKRNYDKQLKRITFIDKNNILDPEITLDTDTFTTAGDHTLSWSNAAQYKRLEVTTTGSSSDLSVVTKTVTKTSVVLTISGTTINVTVTVKGNEWQSTEPTYQGEFFNYDNIVNGEGNTARVVNPLLISDSEAENISKNFISDQGNPVEEMSGLKVPYVNTLVKTNDMVFPWVRNRFVNNLFFIEGASHFWSIDSEESTFETRDSGLNFEDIYGGFTYDAGLYNTFTDIPYNIGVIYDGTYGPNATESEIRTTANYGTSSHKNPIGYA